MLSKEKKYSITGNCCGFGGRDTLVKRRKGQRNGSYRAKNKGFHHMRSSMRNSYIILLGCLLLLLQAGTPVLAQDLSSSTPQLRSSFVQPKQPELMVLLQSKDLSMFLIKWS